jgi:hypothetical protein
MARTEHVSRAKSARPLGPFQGASSLLESTEVQAETVIGVEVTESGGNAAMVLEASGALYVSAGTVLLCYLQLGTNLRVSSHVIFASSAESVGEFAIGEVAERMV